MDTSMADAFGSSSPIKDVSMTYSPSSPINDVSMTYSSSPIKNVSMTSSPLGAEGQGGQGDATTRQDLQGMQQGLDATQQSAEAIQKALQASLGILNDDNTSVRKFIIGLIEGIHEVQLDISDLGTRVANLEREVAVTNHRTRLALPIMQNLALQERPNVQDWERRADVDMRREMGHIQRKLDYYATMLTDLHTNRQVPLNVSREALERFDNYEANFEAAMRLLYILVAVVVGLVAICLGFDIAAWR
ncbi:hypothetical protein B0T24DRAFT_704394 [Lasiosphaeria ovina]|uniref:Uncharacterized protein n=1 Tax=Lasiosphaeria ovina TaxID=92902 RepID=A0AAE0N9A7_9PEZI|nr:hypothetical protein B0T24DRAFT_704394 [Lasiosphaeria ovina]